jgi:AcrR family transcriptional regulator
MAERTYHHGDLRRALLDAAIEAITETGPAGLSLRDLARRAGVSHAGPTHHFRDKPGLLTALATEGYDLLTATLTAVRPDTGSLLELGVAYVGFAAAHRAYFEVMFRPDLYRADDVLLMAARNRATDALYGGVTDPPDDVREAGLAAWSLAHGFATLWLGGALPIPPNQDPTRTARQVLRSLGSP